jgi:hypothetical protein
LGKYINFLEISIINYFLNKSIPLKFLINHRQIPNIKYTYGNRAERADFTKLVSYLSEKEKIIDPNDKV